ncbi:NADH/ubiquinone/plastoquinone (complex I) [Thioalkalivibrio sulfidiphilus HL-EbGr7]|uniref:NADH/ubiquinone/plastoquinone (Complex I) n=1 Tax=Thioalkalivibrio sulfidiphilus (strain HL-EbGR7) TaxID=396588 RepID=B8GMS1_THISH|nr:complex I subunit 5 family protein [Thioalkalivibrio sulfidiphilus]ACL73736.1 NADH/ubiquinone/plastoquinone (complex I) [Thioalkalivibrio sulfidiphilus HL-EbGr7]
MTAALLLAVPLLPLLLAALVPWRGMTRLQWLTPLAVLPGLAVVLFLPDGSHASYSWLIMGMDLQLDATGRVFLLLTTLLWGAAGLYGLGYLRGQDHTSRYHLFFLLAMSGNLGLVLAADAMGFYLFFALMSLSSYGLVVHAGGDAVYRAGRIYLIMAVVGELLLFAGLVLHVSAAGGYHFSLMAATPLQPVTAALLLIGFGIKAGLIPLHVWLPLAHPAAPTPASAVLSGAMIKAGLLGWLRLLQLEGPGWEAMGWLLVTLGLAGAFLAALVGVLQSRPKTILAYSSISQMGLMICGVGLIFLLPDLGDLLLAAVVLYALHHGLAKGALFLGVGIVERNRAPWVLAVLALPALALAGLPWTSGALAKQSLKSPLYEALPAWAGTVESLLTLAAVGTTLLMARFLWCLWIKGAARPGHLPWQMWMPWLVLSFAALVLPWVWVGQAGPAWSLIWPLSLGVVLSLAGLLAWRGRRVPQVPEGDVLLPVEGLARWLARTVRSAPRLWQTAGDGPARARLRLAWRRTRQGAARLEAGLGRWETVGIVFMALLVGVFVSLWV